MLTDYNMEMVFIYSVFTVGKNYINLFTLNFLLLIETKVFRCPKNIFNLNRHFNEKIFV